MDKKVFAIYKVPLALSLTVSIVILAVGTVRNPIDITAVLLGGLLGTFVLDLEYVLYAYLLEPSREFSKTLLSYIKHRDIKNALLHIHHNKNQVTDKSLNSALFQIVLGFLCIFVITSTRVLFAKALVLSTFASTVYKLLEHYFDNKIDEWFWSFKTKPNKQQVQTYIIGAILVLALCIYLL